MLRHIAFDVETTGLRPIDGARIIEIGAVVVFENKVMTEEFHSLVNAGVPISKSAQQVHGISSEILYGAPTSEEALQCFSEFISGAILIAHNAKFDIGFLRYEFGRLGLYLNNKSLCTLKMSRKLLPTLPNHRLETVYRYLVGGIPTDITQHRALGDARMAAQVWLELLKKY